MTIAEVSKKYNLNKIQSDIMRELDYYQKFLEQSQE